MSGFRCLLGVFGFELGLELDALLPAVPTATICPEAAAAAALGSNYSDGEKLLLTMTNALNVDPNIRRSVTGDVGQEDQGPAFAQRVLFQGASQAPAQPAASAPAPAAAPAAAPRPMPLYEGTGAPPPPMTAPAR